MKGFDDMPAITTTVLTDERTWQGEFYKALYGDDYSDYVSVDRSTDGYTDGIIFEHKINLQSTGRDKPLSQALIYLTRFNRDGVPVPAKICLVGQEDNKCYIYDTNKYLDIINDIPKYANLKASDGISGFKAGKPSQTIDFDMTNPARGMRDLIDFVENPPEYAKVTINEHNVYGWATYYYDHASDYKQKPEKKAFFNELKKPVGTLEKFIVSWKGKETDFKYIMDMLNDPMTQKKLGAFYTPPAYAKKAVELVKQAIARVPDGNDYVIIDRCAGTGNLEMYLDDGNEDILSHVIVSTYELKEWMVLKDRYHGRVRYIIPPVPKNPTDLPDLNDEGFLSGANALTRDIIDNPEVRKYLDDDKCTIILFENPPYIESQSIEYHRNGGTNADWKDGFVVQDMKTEIVGAASNDMANAFIWSAFKYFLRQPTDSYVVFSPVKYWKAQKLISKKFMGGFAFNRLHFHAKMNACIMCAYWSNENDNMTEISLQAYDMDENAQLLDEGYLLIKQIRSFYSEEYYDKRNDANDTLDGIMCDNSGIETDSKNSRVQPKYNDNIIAYMVANSSGFDNPDLTSKLTRVGNYAANGFFVRSDSFIETLPMFAASRYVKYNTHWTERARIMKSADKSVQYKADIASGVANKLLCQSLIFTCFEPQNHCRSMNGSDGRYYKNELCFDNLDGKSTLAYDKLNEFIRNGYKLSKQEKEMFDKWNDILTYIHDNCDEYNSDFSYGLYQIDEEINIRIQQGVDSKGNPKMIQKYGDLNNYIKDLKAMVKQYYLDNLVDTLFEYEFLK